MKHPMRLIALLLTALLCLSCVISPVGARREREPAEEAAAENRLREMAEAGVHVFSADETVRVIVRMEGAAKAEIGAAARADTGRWIAAQHTGLRQSMKSAGIAYTERFSYDTLLNALALDLAYGDLEKLARMPGVRDVYMVNRYAPPETVQMESSNEMTGAAWMQDIGYQGSGTVIAVLDTGVLAEHEVFQVYDGMLEHPKLTEAEIRSRIDNLGYGTYVNQKLVFFNNYADWEENELQDEIGHGTHVAGIAAGYAKTDEGAVLFRGTAPDAQLLCMKIFSDYGDRSTDSSIYFKALEDAYNLGADVINLSVGAPNGFSYSQELEDEVYGDIYQNLRDNGVVVAAAAGNGGSMAQKSSNRLGDGYVTADYADYGVLSTPSSYGQNLSVASAENACVWMYAIRAGERTIRLTALDDHFYRRLALQDDLPWEYTVIPGYGRDTDYEGLLVQDRIALVSRGEISFEEKLHAAWEAGAVGVLVYNNEPGDLYMDIGVDWLPSAAISAEDGAYLISLAETVEPPPAVIGDDSDEDLGSVYQKIKDQDELKPGRYLIVNDSASVAFRPSDGDVNNPGNYLPVSIRSGFINADDELWGASMQYAADGFSWYGLYLGCGGEEDEVVLDETPEDLLVTVRSDGTAEIRCGGCSFRYDKNDGVFRFFLPSGSLINDKNAQVSLYKLGTPVDFAPTQMGSLTISKRLLPVNNENGWLMSEFSSMGVTPDLRLKPSVTGVGGSVLSASAEGSDYYVMYSGTSMATPNLSGTMACMLQYLANTRPDLDRVGRMELAEALLLSTAKVLTDADGRIYSPRKQGAGLVDLKAAAQAKICISEPLLSLGDSETGSFRLCFEVRNLTQEAQSYLINVTELRDQLAEFADEEGGDGSGGRYNSLLSEKLSSGLTIQGERTLSLPAGGNAVVELELQADQELVDSLLTDFPNGAYLDGFVSLTQAEPSCDGKENCPGRIFTDMPKVSNWAHAGIDFVLRHGIFGGTGDGTTFQPGLAMDRAMTVTVLYAMAGKPEPQGPNPFKDVKKSKWYYKAVLWAAENGIVGGVAPDRFDPTASVTREQLAAMLYRYAAYKHADTLTRANIKSFADYGRIHSYFREAMSWAVGSGLLAGAKVNDQLLLKPRANANRDQVATIFMGFVRNCLEPPALESEAHAAFTGFIGDWSAAPIIEAHDWREIVDLDNWVHTAPYDEYGGTYARYGSYLDFTDFEVNTQINMALLDDDPYRDPVPRNAWLGDNPYGVVEFNEARSAISSTAAGGGVYLMPMLLRNARHLIMTVTDAETGALRYVEDSEYTPKAYWDIFYYDWRPSVCFHYRGQDAEGQPLPSDTELEIRFYGNLDWGEDALGDIDYEALADQGAAYLLWSFGLTVDNDAPLESGLRYDPAAKTLDFTLTDNQFLAHASLTPAPIYEEDGYVEYFEPIWQEIYGDEEPGCGHSVSLSGIEPGGYLLEMTDYAGNVRQVMLGLSSKTALFEIHFVCPEGCTPGGIDGWYATRGAELSLPWLEGELRTGSFRGWISEPLPGVWSYNDLVDAALDEEIRDPGTATRFYGESWVYALLKAPVSFGDPSERVRKYGEGLLDYTGTWAFAGFDERSYFQQMFLNSVGDAVPQTVSTDEENVTWLNAPDPELLFTLSRGTDGLYTIRNMNEDYLIAQEEEIGFSRTLDSRGCWEIRFDREGLYLLVNSSGGAEKVLCYDLNACRFCLSPIQDFRGSSHRQPLALFGGEALEYGYFTPEEP